MVCVLGFFAVFINTDFNLVPFPGSTYALGWVYMGLCWVPQSLAARISTVLLKSFVHFYPSCDVMLEMNVKIQTEYLNLLRLLNFRLEGNEENMNIFFLN